ANRFVITKGFVDQDYASDLWNGTWDPGDGDVTIRESDDYASDPGASSLVEVMQDLHLNTVSMVAAPSDSSYPSIDSYGTLRVRPIALTLDANGNPNPDAPYFRLKYELLGDDQIGIRVTSQGVDGDITRTLQMDFLLQKKLEFAVISPNRLMIGKNVRVEGPLGTRFGEVAGELETQNGDPLLMRSDFYYLDALLDADLDVYFAALQAFDVDGDGRLRPGHPTEMNALAGNPELVDYDGDEYVDDFDLFMSFYDSNSDGMVVYDTALSGGLPAEFTIDEQLSRLIDEARPDRDGDEIITASDTALGYKDGVISALDQYAKVQGNLSFTVSRAAWEAEHGTSYQSVVHGPIRPTDIDDSPINFEVPTDDLLEITTAMLATNQTWYSEHAGGEFGEYDEASETWDGQVGAQVSSGGTYTHPDATTWEAVPFGSSGAYDYYQRPVFKDMTFTNVVIPKGTNGLFVNCTFVGVTFVDCETDCVHENWNYAGAKEPDPDNPGQYRDRFDVESEANGVVVPDTRTASNNIRFDGCTFLGTLSGSVPGEYTHWRNKIQFTGPTRFYIDADDPDLLEQPDATQLQATINGMLDDDVAEMEKSSVLLPGWSVDVGSFDNAAPRVKLKGTIIAGILDARGTVDVFGTLLMTYRPADGEGALFYGGQVDAFNTTIGYFGPSDGDNEGIDADDPDFPGFGEITLRYNADGKLPDGIPWPIGIEARPATYFEGASM
ncbi:MAG: hypothetical protein ACYTGR_18565, partial [Planctomycetota bacterium]